MSPGIYRICAGGISTGFTRQCFDEVPIRQASDYASAVPVEITDGSVAEGIGVRISEGGRITGTLRDARNGSPVRFHNFLMQVYDSSGALLEDQYLRPRLDIDGHYELDGFPDGTFYLVGEAYAGEFHGRQIYPGIACPNGDCSPVTNGQPITISNGQTVSGIDFQLEPTAVLKGVVRDRATQQPIGNVAVSACELPVIAFPSCRTAFSDPTTGKYEVAVDVGSHTLYALAPDSHVNIIYPDTPCLTYACSRQNVFSVSVQQGDSRDGLDLELPKAARISGVVADSATGAPLQGAYVALFDSNYRYLWNMWVSDSGGIYETPAWVSGTYYVAAYNERWSLECALYPGLPCPATYNDPAAIEAANPTPVIVAEGELKAGIDIAIVKPGKIFVDGFDSSH